MLRMIDALVNHDEKTGKKVLVEHFQSGILNDTAGALAFLHYGMLHPRVSSVNSICVQEWTEDGGCTEAAPTECSKAKALQTLESLLDNTNLCQVSVNFVLSDIPTQLTAQFTQEPGGAFTYTLSHAGHVNCASFMQEVEQAAIKKDAASMTQKEEQDRNKFNLFNWLFGPRSQQGKRGE